jgi:alkylated DNA repair dioxygenase AlkB
MTPTADSSHKIIFLQDGGTLWFVRKWLSDTRHDKLLETLKGLSCWKQQQITLYGKSINQPRLTAAWVEGPTTPAYSYSGLTIEPATGFPDFLERLREDIVDEAAFGLDAHASFNYILGNYYRDGKDSIGFHADDEPSLGKNPLIASLSLGASRRFVLKHKTKKDVPPVELTLPGGSLLFMSGPTQENWVHGIPKTATQVGERINLTFRDIVG